MWGAWSFVAPRLRTETERTETYTLTSYLAKRFEGAGSLIPLVSGLASLLFFAVYVAAGFLGIGILFETLLGTDRLLGIGIAIAIVALYTSVGGFYSICWVDLWQALFLLLAILLVPLVLIFGPRGETLLHSISLFPTEVGSKSQELLSGLFLMLGWGLGYFGQGHILSKFMGIESASKLSKSKWVGLSWQTICLIAATLIGLLAQGYFLSPLHNPELAFVDIVVSLFPPFIAGLVLCAVLAATISTIDSQVIVLVSILSEDFYHRFLRKSASQREVVVTSRLATLGVCAISFWIAARQSSTIMNLVMYAWSGLDQRIFNLSRTCPIRIPCCQAA